MGLKIQGTVRENILKTMHNILRSCISQKRIDISYYYLHALFKLVEETRVPGKGSTRVEQG